MPRVAATQSKPAVLHQTIEIPASQTNQQETPKESRPDFWTYMQKLTPEEWKNHIVYLTRERPKTHMNGVVGGYIAKIVEPFDVEDIKLAYGGYEFSYIMKKGRDLIYRGNFSVEAPPILDKTRESASNGDSATSGLLGQFVTMLKDELERSREANGGDHTTEKAVDMLSKASDRAMEMIQKRVPEATSPSAALKDLVTVAKDLGILGGGGGGNSIIDTIKTLKELGLIGQQNDPMKNLETMLGVFDKLDGLRGGGRRRDWKEAAVEKGLEMLPNVLDTFRDTRNAAAHIATERARAAEHLRHIQNPSARPGVASVMTPRPAAVPSAAHPDNTGANPGLRTVPLTAEPGEPAAAAPAELFIETVDRNSPAFLNTVKICVVEMVQRGDHGEQIVDFLDGAKPGFSNTLVQYTPEQLTAYFAMDPILCDAVKCPNWLEVLDEARNYILEEQQEIEPAAPGKPN
jgi:hypothetical protein